LFQKHIQFEIEVHVCCETEFEAFPVSDVIDIMKSKFLVKYIGGPMTSSITCKAYANCAENCNEIV